MAGPMTTEIVIPPQVRAGRALLGWSQEELAREAGVAVTTVRDVEAEKRAATVAVGEVVRALKNGGVEFVAGSATQRSHLFELSAQYGSQCAASSV